MPAWTQLVMIKCCKTRQAVWGQSDVSFQVRGCGSNQHKYHRFYSVLQGIRLSHCAYGIIATFLLVLWVAFFWADGQYGMDLVLLSLKKYTKTKHAQVHLLKKGLFAHSGNHCLWSVTQHRNQMKYMCIHAYMCIKLYKVYLNMHNGDS